MEHKIANFSLTVFGVPIKKFAEGTAITFESKNWRDEGMTLEKRIELMLDGTVYQLIPEVALALAALLAEKVGPEYAVVKFDEGGYSQVVTERFSAEGLHADLERKRGG